MFILNLENMKKGHFYKSQGKPRIVKEFSMSFIQFKEESGKTNYLVSISFSLTIGMAVCKVVSLIVVSRS